MLVLLVATFEDNSVYLLYRQLCYLERLIQLKWHVLNRDVQLMTQIFIQRRLYALS